MINDLYSHTDPEYAQELKKIHLDLIDMCNDSLEMATDAFASLMKNDELLARKVMKADQKINETEKKLDSDIISIIARRQPAAGDLRLLFSGIKLIQDIERISDEAKRFALNSALIINDEKQGLAKPLQDLCDLVIKRYARSAKALESFDISEAMVQLRKDADIEVEQKQLLRDIVKSIKANPEDALHYVRVNNCIRCCDRISGRSSNICEFIVFQVQGLDVRHTGTDTNSTTP